MDFLILFYESNSVPSILTSISTSLGGLQPSDEAECMFYKCCLLRNKSNCLTISKHKFQRKELTMVFCVYLGLSLYKGDCSCCLQMADHNYSLKGRWCLQSALMVGYQCVLTRSPNEVVAVVVFVAYNNSQT